VRRAGSEVEVAASFPAELGPDEALRDRLAPGRCLALLPLVHLLARLRAPAEPPVTRAAFVLDDPNLHWPRYGPVDYAVLAGHALVHDYHVAMAMVPLDGWLAHPRAVHVFRTSPQRLSVAIHGNDHAGPELGRVRDAASAARIAAQALRRMTAFERRTGIAVSRVMVPPHEELSEPAVAGLLRCGYDAVCTTRPYPWLAAVGRHWLTRPPGADVLAGWWAAPRIGDGLPLLLRHGFDHAREDLVLRAFLGQPLIVYGHPGDLADGLEPLAETAAAINRLGDVRWGSLGELARASRGAGAGPDDAGPDDARPPAVAPVGPYPQPPLPPSPPPRLWPVARRLAGESRDRLRAGRPRKRRPPSLVHRS
jgi:hypothetical protein